MLYTKRLMRLFGEERVVVLNEAMVEAMSEGTVKL
jgi:hypothetical protein